MSGVAELVRLRLLQGSVAPGALRTEALLATEFHTTRTTMREALRVLEGRGLLRSDPSGGMHVAELDEDDVRELLWLRLAVEPSVAARAAELRQAGALGTTDVHGLRRMAEEPTAPGLAALQRDRTLVLSVARLAGVRPAQDALHRAWDQLLLAARHAESWADRLTLPEGERGALAEAVEAGDAEAAARVAAAALAVVTSRWG